MVQEKALQEHNAFVSFLLTCTVHRTERDLYLIMPPALHSSSLMEEMLWCTIANVTLLERSVQDRMVTLGLVRSAAPVDSEVAVSLAMTMVGMGVGAPIGCCLGCLALSCSRACSD